MQAKTGSSWKQNSYAVAFAQMVAVLGFSVVMPILPLYVRELGVHDEQQVRLWSGLVFSSQAVTMAIFGPIWGAVSDRHGRKLMLERAMFGGAVLMALMGFAQNVQQLVLIRAIQGVVTGVVTAADALVATTTPREHVGFALGLNQLGLYTGASLGPLIGGVVCDTFGYRAAFWMTGVLLFVAGILVLFMVQESFQRVVKEPVAAEGKRLSAGQRMWAYLVPVLGSAPLLAVLGMRVLTRTASGLVSPVLALFVESISPVGTRVASTTGLISGVGAAAGAVGALAMGRIGDRLGSRGVMFFCCVASAVCYVPQCWAPSPTWMIPLQAIGGLAMGGILVSVSSTLARLAPRGQEGMVYGVSGTAMAVANGVGPMAGSAVAAWLWLGAPFVAAGVVFALSAAVAALFVPRPERAKAEVAVAE